MGQEGVGFWTPRTGREVASSRSKDAARGAAVDVVPGTATYRASRREEWKGGKDGRAAVMLLWGEVFWGILLHSNRPQRSCRHLKCVTPPVRGEELCPHLCAER